MFPREPCSFGDLTTANGIKSNHRDIVGHAYICKGHRVRYLLSNLDGYKVVFIDTQIFATNGDICKSKMLCA